MSYWFANDVQNVSGNRDLPVFHAPYFREVGKHKICKAANLDEFTCPLIYIFTILGYSMKLNGRR